MKSPSGKKCGTGSFSACALLLQIVHILHRDFPRVLGTAGVAAVGVCDNFLFFHPNHPKYSFPHRKDWILAFFRRQW